VSTNIREFIDLFVDWGSLGHGAALASVGLTLQNLFREIYIACGADYANLSPVGAHPLLDPLWSTERLSVIHDGCEATRLIKIQHIARFPITLKTLRVCYQTHAQTAGSQLNCGRCEKCLRTMIGLHISGALAQCQVLPQTIPLQAVRMMSVSPLAVFLSKELYKALGTTEEDEAIKGALEVALAKLGVNLRAHKQESRAGITYTYHQRLQTIQRDIEDLIPPGTDFILVDESQLKINNAIRARAIPFPEQNGQYWGPPTDDDAAIREIEKQRQSGATHIVFAWPSFWWLDHYSGMHHYLETNYNCSSTNENLIAFDLRAGINSPN
jgi:hypothetical protein